MTYETSEYGTIGEIDWRIGVMRPLTREEGKLVTRRRLLEAAATILRESGWRGLSASAVAREAGIAQPTFYVHFEDKDDLIRTLARETIEALRRPLQEARSQIARGRGMDAVRDTYRVPLEAMIGQPELFRLFFQEAHQPSSPLGEQARQLRRELEADLVRDLVAMGAPARTRKQRERLEMMAEGMIALTETFALGCIEGRYTDLDAMIDVLTRFTIGALGTLGSE
jgi:AcrR family transcriptional regulator